MGNRGCIDESLGAGIFGLHVVVVFFHLEGPCSKICGQDRFDTEAKSQVGVQVGLELGFELISVMIVVDTRGEVNPKETKAQLTTTAGALDMRGFD